MMKSFDVKMGNTKCIKVNAYIHIYGIYKEVIIMHFCVFMRDDFINNIEHYAVSLLQLSFDCCCIY